MIVQVPSHPKNWIMKIRTTVTGILYPNTLFLCLGRESFFHKGTHLWAKQSTTRNRRDIT